MSYADRQDLIDRFGQTEIESLDPGAADGAFARVTTALADAAAIKALDAVWPPPGTCPCHPALGRCWWPSRPISRARVSTTMSHPRP